MTDLASRDCVAIRRGAPGLEGDALRALAEELGAGWDVTPAMRLEKEYRFPDFVSALAFTNRVGELAEAQNHHPDIALSWGRVRLSLWTHDAGEAGGLTENDFIFTAKAEQLANPT